ncbi:MAG: hypothetical protein ACXACI_09245 [Candidatus Hodarchaeales archaeon]|jgi:hypothetical protein
MSVSDGIPIIDLSLIWGNLRNLVDFKTLEIPIEIVLTGTVAGTFPVNSYHPIFLEIPKDGKKMDVSGRSGYISATNTNTPNWRPLRIVPLPIYKTVEDSLSLNSLKWVFESWQNSLIPDDIPCLALAINTTGNYSDIRESQQIVVLLIWADCTARILKLDWFEGPLEDCISPEWYLSSSEWLSLENAFAQLKNIYSRSLSLINPIFSMFIMPSCLGQAFQGEKREINGTWECEWIYRDQSDLKNDIELIFKEIDHILGI